MCATPSDPSTATRRSRFVQLRGHLVRRGDEGPARRRPSDAVRVVVAVLVLVVVSFHAGDPTPLERDVVRLAAALPGGGRSLFVLAYNLLAIWAVGLLVVAGLLVGRWRLARDLVLAGALAWALGRALAFFVDRQDLVHVLSVTFDLTDAPRYPAVRVAVGVAMVIVASPYLTRPTRRIGQVLVAAIALGALYIGRVYPTDLVGALALGWGVAAAVHYALATPVGRPTVGDVADALDHLRLVVTDLEPGPEQPVGRVVLFGRDADGPVRVTALGRDEADAQIVSRLRRYLAYKDAPTTILLTRRQQVEYEAYVELLAGQADVRVPGVIGAVSDGALAVLVERVPPGTPLFEAAPVAVSDAVLRDCWTQLQWLRAAGIAHGKLDGRHLFLHEGAVTFAGFECASTSAGFQLAAGDVAELLAATAAIVGDDRAVAGAAAVIGPDALAEALPRLQPQAISGWTHDRLGPRDQLEDRLAALREVAARAAGVEPPELRQLYRVHPRNLLMAVGALLAVGVLLSRIGDPAAFWASIRGAEWGFVLLAFMLGILTDVAFGITFLGNVPIRIPVWPSIELQSAMSFSNLAVPVAADTALQVRFLQKQGLDLPSAVATGGLLSSVSEIVVQLGLFVVALWLAPDSISFGRIDTDQIAVVALGVVFLAGVGIAVAFSIRRIRRAVLPPALRAARTVWQAVKTPSRLALLVGGNVVAQCLYAGSLLACLHAFGASVDFWTLVALNIGVSTIASLVPIPGGGTAVSAVGLAGMLTALGVPSASVAAAVLTHQLAVAYLPAIPGWFATNDLVRKGML